MQTSNPATDSEIEGFKSIKLDYKINGMKKPWGGLGLNTGFHYGEGLISDTPTDSRWFMCIGCQNWYPSYGTIPGPRIEPSKAVTRVDIYVVNGKYQNIYICPYFN